MNEMHVHVAHETATKTSIIITSTNNNRQQHQQTCSNYVHIYHIVFLLGIFVPHIFLQSRHHVVGVGRWDVGVVWEYWCASEGVVGGVVMSEE